MFWMSIHGLTPLTPTVLIKQTIRCRVLSLSTTYVDLSRQILLPTTLPSKHCDNKLKPGARWYGTCMEMMTKDGVMNDLADEWWMHLRQYALSWPRFWHPPLCYMINTGKKKGLVVTPWWTHSRAPTSPSSCESVGYVWRGTFNNCITLGHSTCECRLRCSTSGFRRSQRGV